MSELIDFLQRYAVTLASVIGAVGVIWSTCGKPLKMMLEKIDRLTDDVARLQGNELNRAYDYHMQQGWCTGAKKREL